MKIYVNFAQSISIINTLNLNWNRLIVQMLPFYKILAGNAHNIISFECSIDGIMKYANDSFFIFI